MPMIDIDKIYSELKDVVHGNQKKITVISPLGIYFGYSEEGYMRLSFLSTCSAPKIESTKTLRVTQSMEREHTYWTCFDLLAPEYKIVFFTFAENLIESVTDTVTEQQALSLLKKRYITWKAMFKKEAESGYSHKELQGLFGELYFIKHYMLDKFDARTAIQAWSGAERKSKDFSVGTEWFEIKAVGANENKVEISSLAQLSSDYTGHLVVIRVEAMSDEFKNGESCIGDLLKSIMGQINDETVEGIFINKLSQYGFDISDDSINTKFDVKSMSKYRVTDGFPRITVKSVPYKEITDVKYSLTIAALSPFLEE